MANAKRLLIVDDSEIDRSILRNLLSRFFEISEVENGYAALELIKKKNPKIDGVLLDISMPVIDGFNVIEIMNENKINIPIILVTAEATAANVQRAAKYDVAGFISKPFNAQVIVEKLSNIFGIGNVSAPVETHKVNFSIREIVETDTYISKLSSIYKTFLKNIGLDDSHCSRISKLMEIMLLEYGRANKNKLEAQEMKIICKAAYFYDIGLMGIPTELILKNEQMTSSERDIYENHTVMGANIIWLNSSESCKYFVKVCSNICMHHHERYDGTGFPHGLKGNDNSLYSQMCGLAVRFDRLFTKSKEVSDGHFDFVINELKIDNGAFSSEFIEILSKCKREILAYYKVLESNAAEIGLTK